MLNQTQLSLCLQSGDRAFIEPLVSKRTFLRAVPLVSAALLFVISCTASLQIHNDDYDKAYKIIERSIVFIYEADGTSSKPSPSATGLLLRIPKRNPSPGENSWLQLLVTVRHVVDPAWTGCAGSPKERLFVRLNRKDYDPSKSKKGVNFEPLLLIVDGTKQYRVDDADNDIDLAVILLTPPNSPHLLDYDIENSVPIKALATPSELQHLQPGDPVFSLSLIPGFPGQKRNYPLLKMGNMAGFPTESYPTKSPCSIRPRFVKSWFMASHMNEGSSGAPVFLSSLHLPVLVGIQSFVIRDSNDRDYDIAAVTPISYLYDIIKSMNITRGDISLRTD